MEDKGNQLRDDRNMYHAATWLDIYRGNIQPTASTQALDGSRQAWRGTLTALAGRY
ncbi:MAG: hypothetical protein N2595_09085 [bacterium]|nr:hypothetical protein [bacterium]